MTDPRDDEGLGEEKNTSNELESSDWASITKCLGTEDNLREVQICLPR